MNVHFTSPNGGPASLKFNTTLDFALSRQDPRKSRRDTFAKCGTSWEYGKWPYGKTFTCQKGSAEISAEFALHPPLLGRKSGEASWTLVVKRLFDNETTNRLTAYMGRVLVSNNNASDTSSLLTCLGGAPQDGIRCSLWGAMSTKHAYAQIMAKEVPWDTPLRDGVVEGRIGMGK
jgi:hypothetical protein